MRCVREVCGQLSCVEQLVHMTQLSQAHRDFKERSVQSRSQLPYTCITFGDGVTTLINHIAHIAYLDNFNSPMSLVDAHAAKLAPGILAPVSLSSIEVS